MNLNATIIAQMVVFTALVWFTMKVVWPMIIGAMQERQRKIAEGLAAGERGQKDLSAAEARIEQIVREARARAQQIEQHAHVQANEIIEAAKRSASTEGARILQSAEQQIVLERQTARDELRKQVASLAVAGAGQLIEREIDARAHAQLLDKLVAQI
ncbi:MAG TPA: F0F1 ATP synthase subunit B [Steroidobacteraceae bacterium]|nr:F0F1 ATP synthase subunit B [Steroidobacteraceae bacterium]